MQEMQETQVWSLGQEDPLELELVNSLQYSCLKNTMDRGIWLATVHGVSKSWTLLSDWAYTITANQVSGPHKKNIMAFSI